MNYWLCILFKVYLVGSRKCSNSFKEIWVIFNDLLLGWYISTLGSLSHWMWRGINMPNHPRCGISLLYPCILIISQFLLLWGVPSFPPILCDFLPSSLGDSWVILIALLRVITFSLSEVGRPNIAGADMSATYHFVWIHLGCTAGPGLQISGHISAPYCGIHVQLYAVSLVVLVSNPVGSPFKCICLGYCLSNTLRGITLPPIPVSQPLLRQWHWSYHHNQLEGAQLYMLLFSWVCWHHQSWFHQDY